MNTSINANESAQGSKKFYAEISSVNNMWPKGKIYYFDLFSVEIFIKLPLPGLLWVPPTCCGRLQPELEIFL